MTKTLKKLPSRRRQRIEHEAEGALTGVLAGAAVGAVAGPPGVIAGAVIGSLVGVLAGVAMDNQWADTADREATLDDEIGVSSGDMGAPCLEHPAATRGTYSAGAAGVGGGAGETPAEGPMQWPDGE